MASIKKNQEDVQSFEIPSYEIPIDVIIVAQFDGILVPYGTG